MLQALALHPGSANFGAAAAKLKGRGGVKAEPGRTPETERTSVVEKNNFKCPRCYKVFICLSACMPQPATRVHACVCVCVQKLPWTGLIEHGLLSLPERWQLVKVLRVSRAGLQQMPPCTDVHATCLH